MAISIVILSILALAIATPVPERVSIKVYPVSEYRPTTTTPRPTTTTTTTPRPTTTEEIKTRTYEAVRPAPLPKAPVFSGASDDLTPAIVLNNSPFTCNGLKDGHYADVHYGCRFFHQCQFFYKSDGILYVQQAVFACGEGTIFNQTMKTCDYANNVVCDAATVKSIIDWQLTAPTPAPGLGGGVQLPRTSFLCNPVTHKQGFYYADVEVGCIMYHRCVYHISEDIKYATQYSFLCAEGTIFDMSSASCQDANEFVCTSENADEQAYLHPSY